MGKEVAGCPPPFIPLPYSSSRPVHCSVSLPSLPQLVPSCVCLPSLRKSSALAFSCSDTAPPFSPQPILTRVYSGTKWPPALLPPDQNIQGRSFNSGRDHPEQLFCADDASDTKRFAYPESWVSLITVVGHIFPVSLSTKAGFLILSVSGYCLKMLLLKGK